MPDQPLNRILFAIPIPYVPPDSFWVRESGLIVLALREQGLDARLIVLGDSAEKSTDGRPVLFASVVEMGNPDWWKSQEPDAIVLNLWSAPRYDGIRKAALAATPRVIERLDTSGVRTPRIWPWYSFVQTWGGAIDRGQNPLVSLVPALLKHLLFRYVPNAMEKPMAETMAQLPYVVAESPLAAARIRRHIGWHVPGCNNVVQISNPVLTSNMYYDAAASKENRMVSVARWDSFQKDFPMLLKTAVEFLKIHPDWSFDLVGRGSEKFQKLLDQIPTSVRSRFHVHGSLPQEKVGEINRRAKIHFLASRWEGFCNATVEALCCGCSYVGPINIGGSSYLIENRSGTIASRRTAADLLDALNAEAEAWTSGRRDPVKIAEVWKSESGYREVAERTLRLLNTQPEQGLFKR